MEQAPQELNDRVDKLVGKISLWASVLLATLAGYWYYTDKPPDTQEMVKMRLFFKTNVIEVGEFLRMPIEKQDEVADHDQEEDSHYVEEVERGNPEGETDSLVFPTGWKGQDGCHEDQDLVDSGALFDDLH